MITTPVWSFTTPATVTKPAPPSLTAVQPITASSAMNWRTLSEAVAGATGYFLTLKNINTNTTGFIESTLPIVTLKLTPGDYQWSVKAYNAEAAGDPSPPGAFPRRQPLPGRHPWPALNGQAMSRKTANVSIFLNRNNQALAADRKLVFGLRTGLLNLSSCFSIARASFPLINGNTPIE